MNKSKKEASICGACQKVICILVFVVVFSPFLLYEISNATWGAYVASSKTNMQTDTISGVLVSATGSVGDVILTFEDGTFINLRNPYRLPIHLNQFQTITYEKGRSGKILDNKPGVK